jgi:hypothetical protein
VRVRVGAFALAKVLIEVLAGWTRGLVRTEALARVIVKFLSGFARRVGLAHTLALVTVKVLAVWALEPVIRTYAGTFDGVEVLWWFALYLMWAFTLAGVLVKLLVSLTKKNFWTLAFADVSLKYLSMRALHSFIWTGTLTADVIKFLGLGADIHRWFAFTLTLVAVENLVSWAGVDSRAAALAEAPVKYLWTWTLHAFIRADTLALEFIESLGWRTGG